jgi:hypothetical protein
MPFFKVPMHAAEGYEAAQYDFLIIEAEDEVSAYDRALGFLPFFGDATDDGEYEMPKIVEVSDPLSEPWPVHTEAHFAHLLATMPGRVNKILFDMHVEQALAEALEKQK